MKDHFVKCSVKDCIYYDNDCCTASSINIDGPQAEKPIQTKCATFSVKGGMLSSILSAIDHSGSTKIKCECRKCAHNENELCRLDSIQVDCSCDPCNCASNGETLCKSFE